MYKVKCVTKCNAEGTITSSLVEWGGQCVCREKREKGATTKFCKKRMVL